MLYCQGSLKAIHQQPCRSENCSKVFTHACHCSVSLTKSRKLLKSCMEAANRGAGPESMPCANSPLKTQHVDLLPGMCHPACTRRFSHTHVRTHLQACLEGIAQSIGLADAAGIDLILGAQECVGSG